MDKDKCAMFCDTCPLMPKGVRAQLIGAEVIGSELYHYRAGRNPEVRRRFAGLTRIHAKVTKSTNPRVEVGDTSTMVLDAEGNGFKGVAQLVNACSGRVSVNWVQRLFRIRTRCGAVDSRMYSS